MITRSAQARNDPCFSRKAIQNCSTRMTARKHRSSSAFRVPEHLRSAEPSIARGQNRALNRVPHPRRSGATSPDRERGIGNQMNYLLGIAAIPIALCVPGVVGGYLFFRP